MLELADRVATEADAYEYLETLRWPNGVECPTCHGSEVALMVPRNGTSRKTTTGAMSQRRVWQCRPCRKQFSAISGTMMHGTKAPIRVWVMVIFQMISAKNGISAREVARQHGVCERTAWFICHRIRETMKTDPLVSTMRGTIVADETHIGGAQNKMNRKTYARYYERHFPFLKQSDKAPVVSLINAETGEVRSRVVANVDGANLRKFMSEHIDMAGSELWTDEGNWYRQLGQEFTAHRTVKHADGQYVNRDGSGTNKAENFFSQLKRSLDGTHHHVSKEHLQRYVDEFSFRYSTREISDTARMAEAVRRGDGRRLTYKRVKTRT